MPQSYDELIANIGFNTACLPDRTVDEALSIGAEIGLGCVELLAFEGYHHTAGELSGLFFDRLNPQQRQTVGAMVSPFERVAVHAPFWDSVPFAANPTTKQASREQLRRTVAVSGEIGAEVVTTHVIPPVGRVLGDFHADVVGFYRELGDVARSCGVTVTVETGYPAEIEQFASLLDDIGHPAVGATVDVGHLRSQLTDYQRRPEVIGEAYNDLLRHHVKSLEGRIWHVHLHDVKAEGVRDHRECGTGIIDYEAFLALLLAQDYSGMVMFELEESPAVPALRRSYEVTVAAAEAAAER